MAALCARLVRNSSSKYFLFYVDCIVSSERLLFAGVKYSSIEVLIQLLVSIITRLKVLVSMHHIFTRNFPLFRSSLLSISPVK